MQDKTEQFENCDSASANQARLGLAERKQFIEQLFRLEYGRMYRAAYLLLGDEDEAKDAVQDIFAQLWAGSIPLRQESVRTFLLTCVRNRCLNIIAHRKTVQGSAQVFLDEPSDFVGYLPEAVDSGTHDEELLRAIEDYIDHRLTPQTSRILRMHYDEAQSYKDISNALGISLSAVNKHIVQGLRKLRSTFKDREV